MEILHPHCAGLDVHKKVVVTTILVSDEHGQLTKETRSLETMTVSLLALSDWLTSYGVTHVAMESAGEYWKPIYNILEENFEVLLVNAQHIKAVPGRKTDVKDSEWIADLLRHGLLKASFIPPKGQRELRDLNPFSHYLCQRTGNLDQPAPESLGRSQHQTSECHHQHRRRFWQSNLRSDH